MRSPQADTDIKSNIYFYILNLHIKIEEGAAASSHDIIRSITMIHCVPSASALRQWRPITFIWHFMAVRSQQLSAMLKGGHRLPRLQKRSRRERARRELEELGERRRRGREGGKDGRKRDHRRYDQPGSEFSLSSPPQQDFRPISAQHRGEEGFT